MAGERALVGAGFPRLVRAGQFEVGDDETAHAGLGCRAPTGGALVADLATCARGRTGERGDRRRVVVRLDLHEHVRVDLGGHVRARAVADTGRAEPRDAVARHDRRVVLVGHDRAMTVDGLGVPDHAEQRARLHLAVDDEVGVEDLVTAVFRVGLREHHELDVGRVTAKTGERVDEVVDLVVGQSQTEVAVGLDQRGTALAQDVDVRHRLGVTLTEQIARRLAVDEHRLGHPVVQHVGTAQTLLLVQRLAVERQHVLDDPLDAVDVDAAVVHDVGGLGGPRRDGAQARPDRQHGRFVASSLIHDRAFIRLAVREDGGDDLRDLRLEGRVGGHPVDVPSGDTSDLRRDRPQASQQRTSPELGERGPPVDRGESELRWGSHERAFQPCGEERPQATGARRQPFPNPGQHRPPAPQRRATAAVAEPTSTTAWGRLRRWPAGASHPARPCARPRTTGTERSRRA